MNYTVEEICYQSSNNINEIKAKVYLPNDLDNVKGIVQVVHGMYEYFDRYKTFIEYLLSNNYIVCGHDHLGHGNSVRDKEDLGYFADKLGYKCLVKDTWHLTRIMKQRFPKCKYAILGHSMGSFVTRCYMYDYSNDVDAVLLSGTIGPIKHINLAIKILNKYILIKGSKYRSKKIMKVAFSILKVNIRHALNKYSWITRDVNITEEYTKDKKGHFLFTASAYRDLLKLIEQANNISNIKKLNKQLPIYIFSGDKDAIGNNGKGVKEVYDILKKNKCNVTLKLYPNGRHEMLNEINHNKVYEDILKWLDNNMF